MSDIELSFDLNLSGDDEEVKEIQSLSQETKAQLVPKIEKRIQKQIPQKQPKSFDKNLQLIKENNKELSKDIMYLLKFEGALIGSIYSLHQKLMKQLNE